MMKAQSKRPRRAHCDNMNPMVIGLSSEVYTADYENNEYIRKNQNRRGSNKSQEQDSDSIDHDHDRPIDYSNHNSSASSSDTECNVVEVHPDQLLYGDDTIHESPSDLDEDEVNQLNASHDTDCSNVALNKNQIVSLTTNLCHKIRKLAKYKHELVTNKNGNNVVNSSNGVDDGGDVNIPIPTPIFDLNALDAYTAFQLSKNYILQQPEFQNVPEISSAITTMENVHHYEIQTKYGNSSSCTSNAVRNECRKSHLHTDVCSDLDRNRNSCSHSSPHNDNMEQVNKIKTKNRSHDHELTNHNQHQLRRLSERHFPALIPPTAANPKPRKRCYVCLHSTKHHKPPKRTDTYYMCVECNRALCAVPCFNEYHTQLNF